MRSQQREAARRAAEAEERAVKQEEAARQARIKAERAAEAQQAAEAERIRREQLEQDLAHKAAARAAREEAERAEEERRVREREERRRRSAEKRAEETRRVEEWKREEERRREEMVRAEEELKRRAIERREAARVAAAKRRRESRMDADSVLLSGWVTVQNAESVAWRRRYFQLTDAVMRLYHREVVSSYFFFGFEGKLSVNGITQDVGGIPSDVIVLKHAEPTIKEWYEGYEELRSISHAFALVFTNGETPIMLFSDSASEKVWLVRTSVSIADSFWFQDLLSGLLMTCP